MRLGLTTILFMLVSLITTVVNAQGNPAKPLRLFVGFAPGGITDILARQLAPHLEKELGQPVIVINQPGASGSIAAHAAAKAQPDGSTLFVGSPAFLTPTFMQSGTVEIDRDLVPVGGIQRSLTFLYVRSTLPVHSMAQLAEYAKANPGKLNFGSSGVFNNLIAAVLAERSGIKPTVVVYKGSSPVIIAMLSGEVDYTTDVLPSFRPHMESGKIRAIAYLGAKREPSYPNVPTLEEAGIEKLGNPERSSFGLWAPAATPAPIIAKLSRALLDVINQPVVQQNMRNAGSEPAYSTSDELRAIYTEETRFWAKAAKLADFKPE